jgi:hypothetical protein
MRYRKRLLCVPMDKDVLPTMRLSLQIPVQQMCSSLSASGSEVASAEARKDLGNLAYR